MKKTVIKGVYLAVVFIIAYAIISGVANQGNTDMTMKMGSATYPVVNMNVEGSQLNPLHGYSGSRNCSFLRESITPLGLGRKVSLEVETFGETIQKLSFEVRSIDGSRLIENTEINNLTMQEENVLAEFTIKDLIEQNTEYMLVILLENDKGETIRYYTRVIQSDELHVADKINYMIDFHNRTFNKEDAKTLTKYLESNSEGDNTTFSKVTIHSSFNQVTWGDLEPIRLTDPEITIKEISKQMASMEINYTIALKEGNYRKLYSVKEFYRLRYTSDRIYLLDYERTMNQIFDETLDVFVNDKISLGITSEEDISLIESDGGNIFAFTEGNRLYSYNVTDNKLSLLFSFYDGDYNDNREIWKNHGIKIMSVDEAENVQFIVYGYMNRGRHEGDTGIAVYNFSGLLNTVEELAYVQSQASYEILKEELDDLAYINRNDVFFFMNAGSVFAVNLSDASSEVVMEGLKENSYNVSAGKRMIAWQSESNLYSCKELILMNLNTKEKETIRAGSDEYIAPLGFMGEDLVYGLAKIEDVVQDSTGRYLFPMYKVEIRNEAGEILMTKKESGIYFTGCTIENNQINFSRIARNQETGLYDAISNEQIMNKEIQSVGNNSIEMVSTEKYEKVAQIVIKTNINEGTVKFLTPKEVLFEGEREVALKSTETESPRYYVYGKNGVEGIFTNESNAVNLAYEISGLVVNEHGFYMWKKGDRNLKNQIMAIKGSTITEEKDSLAVCLDTILSYEGIMRNTEYMLRQGDTIIDILTENMENAQVLNLAGCSLDAVLYYVDLDIPVLASLNDGGAVLIIGFNELNTVLMDPLTGIVYKMGINDSKQLFEENGNRFTTYVREK